MRTYLLQIASLGLLVGALACLCQGAPVREGGPKELAGEPKEIASLNGHTDGPVALTFSPNSKFLASAGRYDGTARLWDVTSGKCLHIFKGHHAQPGSGGTYVAGVAFSPDGKTVASCGHDGSVRLWSSASGKNIDAFHDNNLISAVAFSPDGKRLAAVSAGVKVWDLETRKMCANLKVLSPRPAVLAFTPKSKLLVAGVDYKEPVFHLWDVETGKKAMTFKGHTTGMIMAFSPDGKSVVSVALDHTIRLWEVATGKNTATFRDQPGRGCALAINPKGRILAYGYKHQVNGKSDKIPAQFSLRLLDLSTGKVLATYEDKPYPITPLAFSPDGRLLAAGTSGTAIRIWRLPAAWKQEK